MAQMTKKSKMEIQLLFFFMNQKRKNPLKYLLMKMNLMN